MAAYSPCSLVGAVAAAVLALVMVVGQSEGASALRLQPQAGRENNGFPNFDVLYQPRAQETPDNLRRLYDVLRQIYSPVQHGGPFASGSKVRRTGMTDVTLLNDRHGDLNERARVAWLRFLLGGIDPDASEALSAEDED
ncbi:uncharacterized protein [Branchiostoma lanceolatum]|uniref:uncharacterized protein n=1 Tax=Branchiostoma lanceolatum TaxID=7740 RepID=UPI003454ADA0